MKNFLFVGIILLASFTSYSQEILKLSFQESVNIGLKNNINLKQEHNNLIGARSNYTASMIDYVAPSINANGRLARIKGNSLSEQLGIVQGKVDNVSGSVSANYTIFNGLNKFYTTQQFKSLAEAQNHNIKWSRETVINNVALQYLDALLGQELLEIAESNLNLQNEQLNKISIQVQLGSLAEVDKINQEYQVKNAELLAIRARADLRNRKANLLQLLQLDPTVQLELTQPEWNSQILLDNDVELDQLISRALENRSDLKLAQDLQNAFNYRTKATKGFYIPSISAFYGYSTAYNYIYPTIEHPNPLNRVFNDQFLSDNIRQEYGLSISIPILNGFQVRNAVVQNKIEYENRKLLNENLLNTIKIEVLNAYQDYRSAILDFEASKAQLNAAELSYNLESERFQLGASDFIQLTQANQNLISAKSDYAQSFYTLSFQDILLKYATGTLTLEDIPQ